VDVPVIVDEDLVLPGYRGIGSREDAPGLVTYARPLASPFWKLSFRVGQQTDPAGWKSFAVDARRTRG
jgi:hypothetical protein